MRKKEQIKCFECSSIENTENHHVVPKSLGGARTIPLCSYCHSKVHDKKDTRIGQLTKNVLGKRYCRKVPFGKTLSDCGSKFLRNKNEETVILKMKNLRIEGFSYQKIADILNRESFPTREGRPWIKTSVNMILKRVQAG